MQTDQFIVANIKCNGCATTIKKELLKLTQVKNVEVFGEEDLIKIEHEGAERELIAKKLHELGYPEATEQNGLLLQLKSYASCMLGRISNLQT